jgi:hypothetical protein
MTFNEWKAQREWWKSNTPFAFERVWRALEAAGRKPDEIAEMLDRVGYAMADEYGGSF